MKVEQLWIALDSLDESIYAAYPFETKASHTWNKGKTTMAIVAASVVLFLSLWGVYQFGRMGALSEDPRYEMVHYQSYASFQWFLSNKDDLKHLDKSLQVDHVLTVHLTYDDLRWGHITSIKKPYTISMDITDTELGVTGSLCTVRNRGETVQEVIASKPLTYSPLENMQEVILKGTTVRYLKTDSADGGIQYRVIYEKEDGIYELWITECLAEENLVLFMDKLI